MFKLVKSFIKIPLREKKTVIEVVLLLLYGRILLLLPYKYMKQYFGNYSIESSESEILNPRELRKISRYIRHIGERLPWKCTCLVNAISAKIMLRRRKIPSTIFFGMAKDSDDKIAAHAWVKCGDIYITGEHTEHEYKAVGHFT
ncbi:MAG: lasso peptide biosynthesis B2 protein [bacterium]|nr:lasso peptide biosynthesis B2 protein [bacterium]